MEEIKPCPHCGNKEVELEYSAIGYCVRCYKCGIGHFNNNWTKEYAIESWNKRA